MQCGNNKVILVSFHLATEIRPFHHPLGLLKHHGRYE